MVKFVTALLAYAVVARGLRVGLVRRGPPPLVVARSRSPGLSSFDVTVGVESGLSPSLVKKLAKDKAEKIAAAAAAKRAAAKSQLFAAAAAARAKRRQAAAAAPRAREAEVSLFGLGALLAVGGGACLAWPAVARTFECLSLLSGLLVMAAAVPGGRPRRVVATVAAVATAGVRGPGAAADEPSPRVPECGGGASSHVMGC